ncbi:MAG: hypothetical protein GY866_35980 [Proteobacteria bacterium]|nr:hypothetical protein [Pseudomonadota bacterium]
MSIILFPGGGIAVDEDGSERWIELLKKSYYRGQLTLPDTRAELGNKRMFEVFIDRVVNRRWNFFAKQPFSGPAEVLLYVGRYTHRVAVSNRRILSIDNGKATCEYKDYKDDTKLKTMTLSAHEFIRRFLLHVLPKGYRKIRMYGFLGNSCRAKDVEKARNLIAANHSTTDFSDEMVEGITQSMEEYRIGQCPKCEKGTMLIKEGIEPSGYVYIEIADSS